MRTEDGYVIHKCINGEPEAFGLLVDKYKASIYAFAYTKLRNFRDAEDVTQEVFIQAYQKLRTLREWDSFLAWLYAITSNRCKNLIRSRQNRPDAEFIEDQEPEDLVKPSLDSYRESLALEMLQDALDSLPETYSQVLTLHYLGGMTCKEIAIFLRTSPVAIKKRLSRARLQMKEEILAMMSTTYDQQRLQASFTFRIVELVKRMRINPVSTVRWLPWGLSLGTGLIFSVLSFFPQLLPSMNPTISPSLAGEARASDMGEIPIDILRTSEIPFLVSQQENGNSESTFPDSQKALFPAPQAEGGTWTRKADMSVGKGYITTVALNGKIYAIGGTMQSGHGLSSVEEYDPVKDKWTKKADMSMERRGVASCVVNGKIYAIGGKHLDKTFAAVEEYDPDEDRWIRKADMPTARAYLSASAVNGRIYAIGGGVTREGPYFSIVEEYDPMTGKWTRKADMPTARAGLSTSVVNGKIYAIGGSHQCNGVNNFTALSTVEEYDPVTDRWVRKADMPGPRGGVTAEVLDGKIYVIGGGHRLETFTTVEEYDPAEDTWAEKTSMQVSRAALSASVANGKIYAIGGVDFPMVYLSTVEEYTPEKLEQQ